MLYEDEKPVKALVVISTQHSRDLNQDKVREAIIPYIEKSIPKIFLSDLDPKEIYINPTGQFIIGGPDGDTGLTGRKIIVDTYGGVDHMVVEHFQEKILQKLTGQQLSDQDILQNIVAAGGEKCLIQLAYAIGVSKP